MIALPRTSLLVALAAGLLFCASPARTANYDTELQHNRKAQQLLRKKQNKLQQRDTELAAQTVALDRQLLKARAELEEADKAFRRVDDITRKLERKHLSLQKLIRKLKRQIADEAGAAWMHAGKEISWLDVLAGIPVEEIPHRKHMIELLIAAHEEKKNALKTALEDLTNVQKKVEARREELLKLKREKRQREEAVRKRRAEKRKLLKKVRRDMEIGKRRLTRLQRREKQLARLLARLSTRLDQNLRRIHPHSARQNRGHLPWPLRGRIIGAYGARHPVSGRLRGIQIAPLRDDKIHSIAGGQVKFADWFGGFGLTMVVDYGGGLVAIYAHNDALYRKPGDWVEQGDLLAKAGSTGWVERRLLYFELRDHGKPVNPTRWLAHRR